MSRRACAVVVLPALLAAAFFWVTTERINRNDAALYDQIAKNLAAGNGFSSKIDPPHNWVGGREPLYPVMLAVVFRVFGASLAVVFVLQALMHALTALVVGWIVERLTASPRAAVGAAVVVAVFPTLANYTVYTLRETPFTLLVSLATLLTMIAAERRGWGTAALAGLAWGAAILCRGVVLPLPFLLGAVLIALAWRSGASARLAALRCAVVLVVFTFLPMLPWNAYTARQKADWSAAPRAWQNLYVRASKALLTGEELKMYAVYCLSESVADRMFPGNNLRSVGEGYFYRSYQQKLDGMRTQGMTDAQIGNRVREETIMVMTQRPVRYAATAVFEFVKFNSFFQVPLLNEQRVEARYGGSLLILGLRGLFKVAGFALLALTAIGLWTLGRHGALVGAVVLYFNAVHLVLDSIARYAVPVIPLYLALALIAVVQLAGRRVEAPARDGRLVTVAAR